MEICLPSDKSINNLGIVNGLKFSPREIDIIAALIAGRSTKKIAHFLSLSPRTIENYIYNTMSKLGVNSRQGIIDFIEKSDKFSHIKNHYENLLLHNSFKKSLRGLSKLLPEKKPSCLIVYWPHQRLSHPLASFVAEALQYLSIQLSKESQDSNLS